MGATGTRHREPVNIRRFESPSPTYMTEDGEHIIIAKTEDGRGWTLYRRAIMVSTAYRVAWPTAGQHRSRCSKQGTAKPSQPDGDMQH